MPVLCVRQHLYFTDYYLIGMGIKMKIAICDDEIQFTNTLCPLLERWAEKHGIRLTLCSFTNGDDLIASQRNECVDLIILDVLMPLLNGIDTARELRHDHPAVPIIYLTSSKEFAVDSYEVNAFYYLIKPVTEERLFPVMDKFLDLYKQQKDTVTVAQTSHGFCRISLTDVDYLEAQNKKVLVHLSSGRIIEIREQFSKCRQIFSPENGFCHCHRSYIVNLNNVEQFSKSELTTYHKASIPISRNRYAAFKDAWFHHMFQ